MHFVTTSGKKRTSLKVKEMWLSRDQLSSTTEVGRRKSLYMMEKTIQKEGKKNKTKEDPEDRDLMNYC